MTTAMPRTAGPSSSTLARVHAHPNIEPERPRILANGLTAADGARRAVKDGEEAVARGIDFPPAKAREQRPNPAMMRGEKLLPGAVGDPHRGLGRPDEIREEHSGQNPIEIGLRAVRCRQEPLDGVEQRILVAGEGVVVGPFQLQEPRTGDVRSEVASALD